MTGARAAWRRSWGVWDEVGVVRRRLVWPDAAGGVASVDPKDWPAGDDCAAYGLWRDARRAFFRVQGWRGGLLDMLRAKRLSENVTFWGLRGNEAWSFAIYVTCRRFRREVELTAENLTMRCVTAAATAGGNQHDPTRGRGRDGKPKFHDPPVTVRLCSRRFHRIYFGGDVR
jgi:hypothetical protein